MRWNEIKHEPCSIARSLSIIGDRWTLLILRNAFLGTRRFDDFQMQLGVTRHLLTARLKLLVVEEILKKIPYQSQPTRYEYKLTEKGFELYPVLMSLIKWGNKWTVDERGIPLKHINRETGESIQPLLIDENTGKAIDARNVELKIGPGLEIALEDERFRKRWGMVINKHNLADNEVGSVKRQSEFQNGLS